MENLDDYIKRIKLLLNPEIDKKKEKEEIKSFSNEFKKGFNDIFKSAGDTSFGESFGKFFGKNLKSTLSDAWSGLKNILSSSWKELGNIINYSLLSNARTRELAFGYGLSGSEAYGYDKAMSLMGFESEEDLMYANAEQIKEFKDLFSKYSDKYSKLYDEGFFEEYRKFQIEMEDFKEEVQLEIIRFFMENKDTIINGMKGILEISKVLLDILGVIVNILGDPKRSSSSRISETNDIINSYGGNISNSSNTNVSIDNTFNNVAKEDQQWLSNAGSMTYEQIIQVLSNKRR